MARSIADPFLEFFVLWTENPDNPHENVPFAERVYKLRNFFRLCTLDMLLNTLQGTYLREFVVGLNNLNQAAYKLISAGESAAPIVLQFYSLFPQYTLFTLAVCILAYKSRIWRTDEFYKVKNMIKTVIFGASEEHFQDSKMKPSVSDDRRLEKNAVNIPKSYFNLTQNMMLGPFEILMYLRILGPFILGTMAVLSILTALAIRYLKNEIRENENAQNTSQEDLNQSTFENHNNLINKHIRNSRKGKFLEILQDLIMKGNMALFMLAQLCICSQLLFLGYYDMAMVASQTAVGFQAFARISNYIQLGVHHSKFDNLMKHKKDAVNLTQPGRLDDLLNSLPKYLREGSSLRWSLVHRVTLYCAIAIALLSYSYVPYAAYYSLIMSMAKQVTPQQWLSSIGLVWGSISITSHNIETKTISSTFISNLLQLTLIAGAALSLMHIWPALIPSLLATGIYDRALLLTSFTLACTVFDLYCRTKLLFIFDQIGTWLSQEAFEVVKLPAKAGYATKDASIYVFNKGSDICQGFYNLAPNL